MNYSTISMTIVAVSASLGWAIQVEGSEAAPVWNLYPGGLEAPIPQRLEVAEDIQRYKKEMQTSVRSAVLKKNWAQAATLLNTYGQYAGAHGDYADALQSLKEGVKYAAEAQKAAGPAQFDALSLKLNLNLARTKTAMGHPDNAFANLAVAGKSANVGNSPLSNIYILNARAGAYLATGNFEKAKKDLDDAIELASAHGTQDPLKDNLTLDLHANRAIYYLTIKDYVNSKKELQPIVDKLGLPERRATLYREQKQDPRYASALDNLALSEAGLKNYEKAAQLTKDGLFVHAESQQDLLAGTALGRIMDYQRQLGDKDAALISGLQSIDVLESIRSRKGFLPPSDHKLLSNSLEASYRSVAGLLIERGDLLEAAGMIGMLKETEHVDSLGLRGAMPNVGINRGLTGGLVGKIQSGSRLQYDEELRKVMDIIKNNGKYKLINDSFMSLSNVFRDTPPNVGANVAGCMTLVVSEKIYVVVISRASEPTAFEVSLPGGEPALERNVRAFRYLMDSDHWDPRPLAAKLYKAVTCDGQVDAYLQTHEIKTVIWSLDGILRYIPVAALYDNDAKAPRYLVEKYSNLLMTAGSPARMFKTPDKNHWHILAMGASNVQQVTIDNQVVPLSALGGVGREINGIVREDNVPGDAGIISGDKDLDENFKESLLDNPIDPKYSVVHIASHFLIQPERDSKAYLVLGKGVLFPLEKLTVANDNFVGLDLVALSACDTSVPALNADGIAIDSLATAIHTSGGRAVLGTLWSVPDDTTAVLMQQFYSVYVSTPGASKAEALREAQLDLLLGRVSVPAYKSPVRSAELPEILKQQRDIPPVFVRPSAAPYAHPLYWAPFTLTGNWQ